MTGRGGRAPTTARSSLIWSIVWWWMCWRIVQPRPRRVGSGIIPDVEVVSRDRAGLYAEAAREGAPQARQVADRFHLLQNFREIVERQLGGYEAAIRDTRINTSDNHAASPLPERSDRPSDAVAQTRLIRRERQAVHNRSSTR